MSLVVERTQTVPLDVNSEGVIRVAGTRVTLDTIFEAFSEGTSAQEIAQQYDLNLGDVFAVLSYIVRHPDDVSTYTAARTAQHKAARKLAQEQFGSESLRQELRARQESQAAK
jgi:uncharacterized protein (DUF433 family)